MIYIIYFFFTILKQENKASCGKFTFEMRQSSSIVLFVNYVTARFSFLKIFNKFLMRFSNKKSKIKDLELYEFNLLSRLYK